MKKSISISMIMVMCLVSFGSAAYAAENKKGIYIYEYKDELSLTDKQEKDLRDIIAKFQTYAADKQKELSKMQVELNKLDADKAALGRIKAKINDMAKIKAQVMYEGMASSRAIEAVLTGTQFSRWQGIQVAFVKNFKNGGHSPVF